MLSLHHCLLSCFCLFWGTYYIWDAVRKISCLRSGVYASICYKHMSYCRITMCSHKRARHYFLTHLGLCLVANVQAHVQMYSICWIGNELSQQVYVQCQSACLATIANVRWMSLQLLGAIRQIITASSCRYVRALQPLVRPSTASSSAFSTSFTFSSAIHRHSPPRD